MFGQKNENTLIIKLKALLRMPQSFDLKRKPNPRRDKNFFSKPQKNLNWPNKKPTTGRVI